MPDLIETYRLKYPQVTLSVEAGWSPEIVGHVISHDLDFGIVVLVTPKPNDISQLTSACVTTTEIIFVASPKDPLVKKNEVTFEEFRQVPLILNQEGCLYRHYLESCFAERGAALNIAVEVIGLELQKKLTQLGLGVALLPKPFVASELRQKSLKTFTVKGIEPRSYTCLLYRRDKYINGAMRGFLRILQEVFPKAKVSGI